MAEVVQAGVAVMVAAGNEDTDACLKSPARYSCLLISRFGLAAAITSVVDRLNLPAR